MNHIFRDWRRFWFRPTPSGPLGLFRIVMGLLVLVNACILFPERGVWFSEHGVLTSNEAAIYQANYTSGPRVIHLLRNAGDEWLTAFFVIFILASICMTVGLWTRPSIFLVALGLNAIHNRNPIVNTTGGDCVMLVMTIYLMLAPSDASCSLDRLWRVLKGREGRIAPRVTPWAQRIMQLQLSLVYACTFIGKVQGKAWANGTAIYYLLHLPEFYRFPTPRIFSENMLMINVMTYSALGIEMTLAWLVWVPRLRLYVLAAGVLLHLSIEYTMNIPLFSFLMIASYIPFLTQDDLTHFQNWLVRTIRLTPLRLVYDGECDFCRSALLFVRFFDVFGLVEFLDSRDPAQLALAPEVSAKDAELAAIAVSPKGRTYPGFFAFREIVRRTPAFWLLTPFLYIPGVPQAGQSVYKWVTENRSRLPVAPRYKVKA
ncbi:MAG: DCC1-like thiol-disulfide oxidoreductase family protein [Capsulimonas sp.]|uniref:DCC1-like thiol-disulfide oxidoreductase family protein n=1 Tax=Capsulimonas sp. TaxID=2494211 RepID=UPI00326348C5